jgi:hypothetical protein
MLNPAAAFAACTPKKRSLLNLFFVTGRRQMVPNGFGNGIGAGKDFVCAKTGMGMTGDIHKLLNNLFRVNAAPPGKRDHPADGLALRSSASASLAHGCKEFEQPAFIGVYSNIKGTASGLHSVRPALKRQGAVTNYFCTCSILLRRCFPGG